MVADRLFRVAIIRVSQTRWFWYMRAHHVVIDGFGAMNLIRRIAQRYTAEVSGHPLPELSPGELRALVDAELAYRHSDRFHRDREYWRTQLADVEHTTGIARRTAAAAAIGHLSRAELAAAVVAEAVQRLQVADVELLVAAFAGYLARVIGTTTVVLNLPVAARTTAALRRSAGMTANIVPLRIAVHHDVSTGELLRAVRLALAGAIRHQLYRHEDMRRDSGHAALTTGTVGPRINISPVTEDIVLGGAAGPMHVLSTGGVEDLAINIYRPADAGPYRINVETNPNLYSELDTHRHRARFMEFLHRLLAASPTVPVWDLPILTDTERRQVLFGWNDTRRDLPETSLPDLLDARIDRTPHAIAVVCESDSITYAEFGNRVNRLARYLIAAGAGPETSVGVAMPRSIHMVVAIHAVWRAGAAWMPVDPDHPAERVSRILRAASPVCVLTTSGTAPRLPREIRRIDVDRLELTALPATPVGRHERPVSVRGANLAYVLHTSGSTGHPKGVAVPYRALANQSLWMMHEFALDESDIYLHHTAATFDVSLWGFVLPLLAGATLVVATAEEYRDPALLADLIRRQRVTVADFVPSVLDAFAATATAEQIGSLRAIFVAGEVLAPRTVSAVEAISAAGLHNLYGPTETTVSATSRRVRTGDAPSVPIGRPAWNTRAYVLDSRLRPLPAGVAGELYLAGEQLARGYLARPDLTSDRFVANPFEAGARMYRTGDVVIRREDPEAGVLDYVGRSDTQVKIRGLRVELGEIEAVLRRQPAIAAAAVVVHTDQHVGDRLVAYLVTTGAEFDPAQLRPALADELPPYMIPTQFVQLPALPLNSSGKLDRRALPTPAPRSAAAGTPHTPLERLVAVTVADVLHLDAAMVGAADDFFALGGNSLLATQIAARLGASLNATVPMRLLFDAPTVGELARRISETTGAGNRPPLVAGPRPESIPLAPAQHRMWILDRFAAAPAAYNVPVAIRLSGMLHLPALRAAVADVVARHEVLRTRYPRTENGPVQQILSAAQAIPDLRVTAITSAALDHRLADMAATAFDLAAEVPLRLALFELTDRPGAAGSGEFVLALVIHHIAADGFSMGPLTRDLMIAYTARTGGDAPGWPPLPVQYADYALWQLRMLGSEPESESAQQIGYWIRTLSGLPEQPDLPTDRPRPAVPSGRGAKHVLHLDAETCPRLTQFATTAGATWFMVAHAALAVLLSRLTAATDIAIGTPVAGRGDPALDDLIGMFVNTLVLRTEVRGDLTFADLIRNVRATDIEAFTHADVPFDRVVEALDPPRSRARHPLFQVMLAFQNLGPVSLELPELLVDPIEFPTETTQFDLQVVMTEDRAGIGETGAAGGMTVEMVYATDLFDAATIASLALRFRRILRSVAADPGRPVGDIDLLDAAESAAFDAAAQRNTADAAASGTVADLLSTRFATPLDAVAIVDRSLEHGKVSQVTTIGRVEFAGRVHRLARLLIATGVGPDSAVAVCIQRSLDLMVAMHAVLVAGGCYVPIDPEQPVARVSGMLDTTAPVCVLVATRDQIVPGDRPLLVLAELELGAYPDIPITDADRTAPLRPQHAAYTLFTSGSTGRPKAVTVPHAALHHQILWLIDEFGVGAADVLLFKTPPTFDVSLWELLVPMIAGARTVIAPVGADRDPGHLAELIAAERVTIIAFVTSLLAVFARSTGAVDLSSLRVLIVGGEQVDDAVVRDLRRPGTDHIRLIDAYGPTEATIVATRMVIPDEVTGRVPIGRPIPDTGAAVLDTRLRPVPPGVVGELYLSGRQLARGYTGSLAATAAQFVANPFGAGGSRMYRTGDLVRWIPGAGGPVLEYLGRGDQQVQLHGLRIELGEVEYALTADDSVAAAAVVVDAGRLVAYTVAAADRELDNDELRSRLRTRLPSYMIPAVMIELDALPIGANGKLDRHALPAPTAGTRTFRAPGTPAERQVAAAFAAELGRDDPTTIGADDDFFELGGNSLLAMQVAARLSADGDTRIPVSMLFEAPTVAALAARLPEPGAAARREPAPGPRPHHIPLSPAQRRMWFLNRFDTGSSAYNVTAAVRLTGTLDVAALRAAVSDVVSRHEILRTRYPQSPEGPIQLVVTDPSAIPALELSTVSSAEVTAAVTALAVTAFDVTAAVPLRAALFEITDTAGEFVLVLVLHHLSGDGASMQPLIRDLTAAYAARLEGHAPAWPALAMQYADYSLWHRALLGAEDDPESLAARQLDYWRHALAGLPDQLELPADRPRPPVRSFAGGTVDVEVDAAVHAALLRLARTHNATPFMVVHTAWAVLLARLSGTYDIAVGTPAAGRTEPWMNDLIGMFVNTVVFRTVVQPGLSFAELLARQRALDVEALAHADLPFERLVEELDPVRSPARNPLFQIGLSFQNLAPVSLSLPGLRAVPLALAGHTSQFDLHLIVAEQHGASGQADGIRGLLTYATDLFDERTAAKVADRFVRLLAAIVAAPSTPVGDLPLLDAREHADILVRRNATRRQLGPATTLASLLDRGLAGAPDVVVVTDAHGVQLTRAELARRVNRLARHLIALGIGPESAVAVAMPRSIDLMVALFAVTAAGGAAVPIDPAQPAARVADLLATTKPACLLTNSESEAAMPDQDAMAPAVVRIDAVDLSDVSAHPIDTTERVATLFPQHLAYVIFTSGSTGRPKGVAVPHAAAVNQLLWEQREFGLGPEDVLLWKTPATFDLSVWELWTAMVCGGRVVIASADGHRDPAELNGLIERTGVTTLHVVPSMLDSLLAESGDALPDSLRQVLAIGETLPVDLARRVRRARRAALFNLYGPTEATVSITSHPVTDTDRAAVPIGTPEWNCAVYVLDTRLRPVPDGVIGELYLSGAQLARGYAGLPGPTAERFVADPFEPGARMYRSGDLVAWNADGVLEYRGRGDTQLKIRGVRIEPGEIEATLLTMPEIAQAAVVPGSDPRRGDYVAAYLVPMNGTIDLARVRSVLAARLPSYMLPAALTTLPALPRTVNGKLDRKALPRPEIEAAAFRPPVTPAEQHVARVFAEVLDADRIGADDDFFTLGGNSLLATQVAARLEAALGVVVPVHTVFEAPTVAHLADAIGQLSEHVRLPIPVLGPRPVRIPLSPAQRGMWFLNQVGGGDPANNIPIALRLTGDLDMTALRTAIADVLHRHETLRTVYPLDSDGPTQSVLDADAVVHEPTVHTVATHGRAREQIAAYIARTFDVTAEIPFRVAVFRIGDATPGTHVLVLVAHHIALDGWSLSPLARDVMAAYTARSTGARPDWAPLPLQYADYAVWHSARLGDFADPQSLAAAQIDYWRETLAQIPAESTIPGDRDRPATPSFVGGAVPFALSAATTRALRELARGHRATTFMVVHTALAVLLARLSDSTDVVIGTAVSGRGAAELDDLVGMFVNSVALRTRVIPGEPFTTALVRQREADLAALAHADVPFERVVHALAPDHTGTGSPLFQVALSMRHLPRVSLALPGLRAEPFDLPWRTEQFDLTVWLEDATDGDMSGEITYAVDLFDERTVADLTLRLTVLLDAIAAAPDTPIGDLPLLSGTERHWTTARHGGGLRPQTLLPDLLQAAAAATPDAIALTDSARSLTYRELDRMSSSAARMLIAQGFGPEDVIVVAMPRSIECVQAIWAVAKTGAAWVPVDPAYPPERIARMIADSGARLGLAARSALGELPDAIPWLVVDDPDFAGRRDSFDDGAIGDADRVRPLRPQHPAYAIYTSGSTGTPKGVLVTQEGLAAIASDISERWLGSPGNRVLHIASPSFDMAVAEFLLAVVAPGGTLIVAAPDIQAGPETAALMRAERVTHTIMTPSRLAAMDPAELPGLRTVLTAGEPCPPDLISRWSDGSAGPDGAHRRLVDTYGPSETTVVVTASAPLSAGAPHTVGGPLRGVGLYVLDSRLHPVPIGVTGELYVEGSHLARGYHRRPAQTAARFVACPWAPGRRMYRTGDLVRWTPAGELDYRGRNDSQVKIRGYRIEPGEVDAALTEHESVDFAVTVLHEFDSGSIGLASYVHSAPGRSVDLAELTAHAERRLPAHAVPAALTVIDRIPISPTGKLDRSLLPAPIPVVAPAQDPVGPIEFRLAELFAEVLHLDRVGRHDSFFTIGGDSILTIQLAARARAAGLGFGPRDVFEQRTVARLAAIAALGPRESDGPVPSGSEWPVAADRADIERWERRYGNVSDVWPLSDLQAGMYFHAELARRAPTGPMVDVYTIQLALTLTGALDPGALRAAARTVLDRHPALRAAFVTDAGEHPVQVIADGIDVPWQELDFTARTDAAGAAAELAAADRTRRFDLTDPPLLRWTLIRMHGASWRLIVTVHHMLVDGWSMPILMRDLLSAYASGVLPAAPPSFGSLLQWRARQDRAASLRIWGDTLRGAEPTLLSSAEAGQAPTELPAHQVFALDPAATARLTRRAAESEITVNTVLQLAWGLVLGRALRRDDVVFGGVVSGRPPGVAGVESIVGLFVNTVPIRVSIAPDERIEVALRRIQGEQAALFDHHHVGLTDIRTVAGPGAVFDTILAWESYPFDDAGLRQMLTDTAGLEITDVTGAGGTHYPLTVIAYPGEALRLEIGYLNALFDPGTVRRLGERLLHVLTGIAEHSGPVDDLDLLLPGERETLLRNAYRPGREPGDTTLVDLIDMRVRAQPDAIAVRAGTATLSYAELSRRADAVAGRLAAEGIGPGSLVAVLLERSEWLPIAALAALRAGAAYLPLDPVYPDHRLEFALHDAAPACVLTSGALQARLPAGERPILLVDSVPGGLAPAVRPRPSDLAYVIYTSGSTGTPKGVAVTHRNVVSLLTNALAMFDLGADDTWTVFHSFAFDFAVWELWGALVSGGTAVLVDQVTSRDPDRFRDLLIRERVTVVSQTPSAFHQLDAADLAAVAADPLSLRYIVFGGEALDPRLLRDWYRRYPDDCPRLVNMYGITETTVHVTAQEMDRDLADREPAYSMIGRPLPNLGVCVLDARLRLTPIGMTGDIYVPGGQVARGYLGRPGLTATRFVADPYGPPGSRMYRSGDLGHWSDTGLVHTGRADQQVQLRGFRVELGEIEAVLTSVGGGDVRAVVRDGRLLAYVRAPGSTAAELLRHATVLLPEHMVPAAVTIVDAWPLTVNGKLDVPALPDPEFARASTRRAPGTERERALAAAFREVLELPDIGIDDDFFRVGGDSLSAVRLCSRIRRALGEEMSVQDVFELRTVAALAAVHRPTLSLPARADRPRPAIVPLSFPQQRLLERNARERQGGPSRAYVFTLRLSDPPSTQTVSRALADLTARHEILRTVFPGHQQVLTEAIDFATVATTDVAGAIADCATQPFDLTAQVPLRVRHYPQTDGSDLLLIVLHHMAADGWSMAPFLHDLTVALTARGSGEAPRWAPLPVQYAEHATWQHRLIDELDSLADADTAAGLLDGHARRAARSSAHPAVRRACCPSTGPHRVPLSR